MNPRFPIYIVSKGRSATRLTMKALDKMEVPYYVVVEAQELETYAAVIDRDRLLVLDPKYQSEYDTCDDLNDTKSRGPGPARNFAWDHSIRLGFEWHWVMDDNIRSFNRMNHNRKWPMGDGTGFFVMEDFVLRYDNVAMAGPDYHGFANQKMHEPPFITNTRIYSCNLIRNDIPYRWRARYNEDTDLSIRMLKDGWCTIQFTAFLQNKVKTQSVAGGNTEEFYKREGTQAKSRMLVKLHSDVARLAWRYGRIHHYVDYRAFKNNKLRLREGVTIPELPNEYGMQLRARA